MSKFKIYFKDLNVQTVYGVDLLDAVVDPTHDRVSYFFRKGTGLVEAERAVGGEVESVSMVAGAPVLRGKASLMAQKINRSKVETAFFGDRNVIIAVHNGEGAYVLVDWLAYHQSKFRLGGAVIVERSADARREWNDVATDPRIASMDMRLLVLTTDVPLGNPDLPAEAHPYCVDGAPGRDRMNRPAPDPWRSPIQEFGIYGLVYERYLKAARAVANIDPCDLLIVTDEGVSPFDLAVANPGGVVQLAGRHCYPWRVRKNKKPMFSDHSCVQFDTKSIRQRCCVAPDGLPNTALFRIKRVTGGSIVASAPFWRCMAIRHPPKWQYPIVPKTSLVEYAPLLDLMESTFNTTPVRAPSVQLKESDSGAGSTVVVTCMKNEGPFILEWLAYHRSIGIEKFLVYTNDCADGTDDLLDLLQDKGIVQHRRNSFRDLNMNPQHAALKVAADEPIVLGADWVISMDVDEFINIHVGEGTLPELFEAVDGANLISCTWRLFGNSDIREYSAEFILSQFTRCAEKFTPKPHQAWGFKTLFRNNGVFKKLGVHRPKGLRPQLWEHIQWVNGSGEALPHGKYRNAWRSTKRTIGYDLVTLNHYAVRNAESFLVKRDRGRVNHVDRDQGLAYWFRMNNNATSDRSIQRRIPKMRVAFDDLVADPEVFRQHASCVEAHRAMIAELMARPDQAALFDELTGRRMELMSRMHRHFGASVFEIGPGSAV